MNHFDTKKFDNIIDNLLKIIFTKIATFLTVSKETNQKLKNIATKITILICFVLSSIN